ncbi:hypothetical protein [Amycolatopsis sp. NPDC059657]|uniref:hypothetical protein n=1 Tax=Amycolatopsis sp. NPDC059657 TaxID=3346899 RepID=UPI00367159CA
MTSESVAPHAEFAAVVFDDPGWLRAEFDAIVAVNFGATSGTPVRRLPAPPRRRRGHSPTPGMFAPPPRGGERGDLAGTARRVGARERSPPAFGSPL